MPIKATGKAIDAMKGTPVVLALLIVICATLVFAAYLLGVVATSAGERQKAQLELIESLVKDIRDCRSRGSANKSTLMAVYDYFDANSNAQRRNR